MTGAAPTEAMNIETNGANFKNFVFTGNVFRGSTAGINYLAVGGSTPDQCTFMGNIGDSPSASWSQFVGSWANVFPAPLATFQNFNIDNGT